MTKKVYKTAQGKTVDLGSIILKNENTRAVGNMGVNARGDIIDSQNHPVKSRTEQVSRQYKRQVTNVSDGPVVHSRKVTADVTTPAPIVEPVVLPEMVEPSPVETKEPESSASSGGLAAAIAKARSIRQEPLKSPRQLKQEQSGVNKI